jgi:hypothetical protein
MNIPIPHAYRAENDGGLVLNAAYQGDMHGLKAEDATTFLNELKKFMEETLMTPAFLKRMLDEPLALSPELENYLQESIGRIKVLGTTSMNKDLTDVEDFDITDKSISKRIQQRLKNGARIFTSKEIEFGSEAMKILPEVPLAFVLYSFLILRLTIHHPVNKDNLETVALVCPATNVLVGHFESEELWNHLITVAMRPEFDKFRDFIVQKVNAEQGHKVKS